MKCIIDNHLEFYFEKIKNTIELIDNLIIDPFR
jgi:hypothetical protein